MDGMNETRGGVALSDHQLEARRKILGALNENVYVSEVLAGPAGSGKTTLMRVLAADIEATGRSVVLVAPTGKAAARLRDVTGRETKTVHSALYGRVHEVEDDREGREGEVILEFSEPGPPCEPGGVVICDEASMVSQELDGELSDNLPPGANILYVGDDEQLPPVTQGDVDPYDAWGPDFREPTARLTEIHRQAEGSPIIAYTVDIRAGREWGYRDPRWGSGADDALVNHRRSQPREIVNWICDRIDDDATVVTFTNRVRKDINDRVRRRLGRDGALIVPGERVLCLKNNASKSVMNGEVLDVDTIEEDAPRSSMYGQDVLRVRFRTGKVALVVPGLIGGSVREFKDFEKAVRRREGRGADSRFLHIDYGYVLTVHKSQGSQWDRVGFVSCRSFDGVGRRKPVFRRRLLYTAATRAVSQFVMFS